MNKLTKKQNIIILICILLIIGSVVACAIIASNRRIANGFRYSDHLSETILTIDGENLPLKEASFYVITIESSVNKVALDYNPIKPETYWNLYLGYHFVNDMAKDSCRTSFIRDNLYYLEAKSGGIELSDAILKDLNSSIEKKMKEMTGPMMDITNYTNEEFYNILYKVEMAKAYVNSRCAEDTSLVEEDFNDGGKIYNEIYNKHSVSINKNLWDKIKIGKTTVNND